MVEYIGYIHPELQFLALRNPNAFDQIRIELKEGRAFDRLQTKRSDLARRRIHEQQVPFVIRNCFVGKRARKSWRDRGNRGIRDLLQPGEINHAVRDFRDFPGARCPFGRAV